MHGSKVIRGRNSTKRTNITDEPRQRLKKVARGGRGKVFTRPFYCPLVKHGSRDQTLGEGAVPRGVRRERKG